MKMSYLHKLAKILKSSNFHYYTKLRFDCQSFGFMTISFLILENPEILFIRNTEDVERSAEKRVKIIALADTNKN